MIGWVRQERGFTTIELAVVVLISGIVIAFATPKIMSAMSEYKLNMTMRQLADVINRAKTEAVSENRRASLVVDTYGKRMGLIVYDEAGTVVRTEFVTLPRGISFTKPSAAIAPIANAPTSSSVSFPRQGASDTVFQQDFTSRGFPAVATAGAINALYIGNDRSSYRALTLTSVGGLRTWWWNGTGWVSARK